MEKLHIQLDLFVSYKKERLKEVYYCRLSLFKGVNDGNGVKMTHEIINLKGTDIESLEKEAVIFWEKECDKLQNEYKSLSFGFGKRSLKKYRGKNIVASYCTFNLIPSKKHTI